MNLIKSKKDNYFPLYSLKHQVDSLFNNFFDDSSFEEIGDIILDTAFVPKVNVSETTIEYHVDAELPGIKKEDIKLEYSDNLLTISAERKEEHKKKDKRYYRVESFYGIFQRKVQIPKNIDKSNIQAEFKNGVLQIILPKIELGEESNNFIEVK